MGETSGRNEREVGCDEGIIAELSRWRRGRYRLRAEAVKRRPVFSRLRTMLESLADFGERPRAPGALCGAQSALNGYQGSSRLGGHIKRHCGEPSRSLQPRRTGCDQCRVSTIANTAADGTRCNGRLRAFGPDRA
jgi:hypothetical protein